MRRRDGMGMAGAVLLAIVAYAAPSSACTGDCNGDRRVSIDELVVAVNVALDREDLTRCASVDASADGRVAIDELVFAVSSALDSCRTKVEIDLSGDPIVVSTRDARVEIGRNGFRLAVLARDGTILTRERADGGLYYERAGARHALASVDGAEPIEGGLALTVATGEEKNTAAVRLRFLSERTLEVTAEPPMPEGVTAIGERFESPQDELIYGLTERLRDSPRFAPGVVDIPMDDFLPREVGSLNRRGEVVEMFIRPTFSLYAPFYQSSRGYGVAVQGAQPGIFDVASSDPTTVAFEFETGTTTESRRLVFHVFIGPDHATILDEYTALTGRPFVPPDWAFLNWRWRGELAIGEPAQLDGVPINAQVAEDVRMFEELGIPPGVYLFDRPVFPGNFGFARFEWDETRLPNPQSMLDSLRDRGYRIAIWSSTWQCGKEPGDNGTEAKMLGYLAPGSVEDPVCHDTLGTSFILDVTNPRARTWFRDRLADFLRENRIDAIKLDRGEEHIPSAVTDLWADGRNGREVHNDYVLLQTTLHNEALVTAHAETPSDFTLITRSGYTGAQRDAIFWGGDIPGSENFGFGPSTDLGLRSAIISQQRAAFMGFPIWGSDTGGYYEFKNREVFARWLEFSAFSGIMEIGGTGNHAPWDMPTEPRFDEEMIEIYRRYTRLRVEMLPYIVETAAKAGESGLPMVRPLVFLDRTDPELLDRWDQYLFGPDLMVAPVWKIGERAREVYFPRGRWRSLWEESIEFTGPMTTTIDVPLDSIPVFIRGDAPSPREELRPGSDTRRRG